LGHGYFKAYGTGLNPDELQLPQIVVFQVTALKFQKVQLGHNETIKIQSKK
jgi:hypothetical protein